MVKNDLKFFDERKYNGYIRFLVGDIISFDSDVNIDLIMEV